MKAPTYRKPPKPFPEGIEESKIILGPSFTSSYNDIDVEDYLFMKWREGTSNFKPKSAQQQQNGTMETLDNAIVLLKFQNTAFEGKLDAMPDDKADCILFWDEKKKCLILEKASAQISKLHNATLDTTTQKETTNVVPPIQKFASKTPTTSMTATKTATKSATKSAAKTPKIPSGVATKTILSKRPTQINQAFSSRISDSEDSSSSDDEDSDSESSQDD